MDKKIGQMLCRYIRCDGSDCGADPSSCRYAIGAYKDFEQAFRDDGWVEPQQPEGGLVPNPRPDNLSEVELKFPDFDQGILIGAQDGFDKGSKAQLAHDKTKYQELQGICNRLIQDNTELTEKLATIVKLPDVSKLANEIRAIPDTTPCGVRAEKILEWLKEQKW